MKKQQNYIDGRWCDADSGQVMSNVNPATGETIGLYPKSSSSDVEKAICSARGALRDWRNTPAPARGAFLHAAAGYLKQHIQDFGADVCQEMGKTLRESIMDVQESIDMAEFCAGEGRRNLGIVTSSEYPNRLVLAYREPIGVAGAITPWNYPMAMPAWKIMGALITGNAVVLKPAEDTPQSALNLAKAFAAVGLPPGVLNVVIGTGEEAGAALVDQPGADVISFTGSTEVGKSIAAKCPGLNKRVALEMGGGRVLITCSTSTQSGNQSPSTLWTPTNSQLISAFLVFSAISAFQLFQLFQLCGHPLNPAPARLWFARPPLHNWAEGRFPAQKRLIDP